MKANSRNLLLNCDMGESFGPWVMGCDEQAMAVIDMANIACGFHASDPDVMANTIALAAQHHVRIGAHPGYADKQGFGRRSIPHSSASITNLVLYQYGALQALCHKNNATVSYIKPHGALYHDMMQSEEIFRAILAAMAVLPNAPALVLQAGANAHYQQLADEHGLSLMYEAFADRAYTHEGALVPRNQPGAVHQDEETICRQAWQIAQQGSVTSIDGQVIPLKADTLCVHGDNPQSVAVIKTIREVLSP